MYCEFYDQGITATVDQEIFTGKIFHCLNFRVVLFLSLMYMSEITYSILLFVEENTCCLIFIVVEGDQRKCFHN